MKRINIPAKLNLDSTAVKVQVIKLLEYMRYTSNDKDYINYCNYCLNIIRQSIEFHYYEVLDFIGIEEEPVPNEISAEVILFMDMFNHISISLSELHLAEVSDIDQEYYTNFCGFEESAEHHLAYYIFLVRNDKHRVPIRLESLPLTLNHYRQMLTAYERYKRNTYLTKDMIMNICIRRERQIKFAL